MNYLFGDSTPSELTSNFLEFFRDALDFSVFALLANERINEGKARIEMLRAEADVEIERLNQFIATLTANVSAAEKAAGGDADSPTVACAADIERSIAKAQSASLESIREKLAAEIAQIDADENATRNACQDALATLLRPHDPPDANATTHIALNGVGAYEATREAKAAFGLDWIFDLAIPDGNIWKAPLRVERVVPQLEIQAPQRSGWISKEVKIRPVKLERYLLTHFTDDGSTVTMHLRAELGSDSGFDFTVEDERVTGKRVGPADDISVGAFDIHGDDVQKLWDLAQKLRATATDLEQRELQSAIADEAQFTALPSFVTFVEKFVAMMTPIVREIAERSLTANELVIRRMLSNDRREEIFVSKKTLREKYAALEPQLRAVFAPLGLDSPTPSQRPPSAKTASDRPAVRAELPKSLPPPPKKASDPAPAPSPPPSSAMKAMPRARISSSDLKTVPLAPISATELKVTEDPNRNQVLVAALKKIALLSRNGRTDEAYKEYAALFSSAAFSDYRADDQRAALKLMILAKSPPAVNDIVREAYRAALGRIETLVKSLSEPADSELLGVAQVVLANSPAANEKK
jgi:hypothetical protein